MYSSSPSISSGGGGGVRRLPTMGSGGARSQLNNIEDWVEPSHGVGKRQVVSEASNRAFDSVGTKVAVREFHRRTSGLDVTGVKVDLIARSESGCRSSALVVVPRHGQCRLSLFECVLHPVCELIHRFNSRWRLVWFEAHPRVTASVKEEGCLLRGGVDMVVVRELCKREE